MSTDLQITINKFALFTVLSRLSDGLFCSFIGARYQSGLVRADRSGSYCPTNIQTHSRRLSFSFIAVTPVFFVPIDETDKKFAPSTSPASPGRAYLHMHAYFFNLQLMFMIFIA